jgi:hypothetical protein
MTAEHVIEVCKARWPADKSDCSAFVRDVAHDLGVTLAGNADAIVDKIRADWERLADGPAAAAAAAAGRFVVAGLKGAEQQEPSAHGHVVVVVQGALAHNLYPTAYWGRLGGVGSENQTTNWAWRAGDRDKVTYAAPRAP